jgi:hypothetical protein
VGTELSFATGNVATIGALEVLGKYQAHCESVGLGKKFAESLIR